MKARGMIGGASFKPEVLKVLYQAFDEAWAEIRREYEGDQLRVDGARMNLAHALLAVASEDSHDAEHVKKLALQVFRMGRGSLHSEGHG